MRNFTYSDELYHHGIKGQKWGVRRFQNYDGTLINPKGRKQSSNKLNENSFEQVKSLDGKTKFNMCETTVNINGKPIYLSITDKPQASEKDVKAINSFINDYENGFSKKSHNYVTDLLFDRFGEDNLFRTRKYSRKEVSDSMDLKLLYYNSNLDLFEMGYGDNSLDYIGDHWQFIYCDRKTKKMAEGPMEG